MVLTKTYLTATVISLALIVNLYSISEAREQWQDSVHSYGPWDASLYTAAGGKTAGGFEYKDFVPVEYLNDRDFQSAVSPGSGPGPGPGPSPGPGPGSSCPSGLLCGYANYEKVIDNGTPAPEGPQYGSEPALVLLGIDQEVDESFVQSDPLSTPNSTLSVSITPLIESADYPDLGPHPIPAFYWDDPLQNNGFDFIVAQGSSADDNESREAGVVAVAYSNDDGPEFVYGNWEDIYTTNPAAEQLTQDRHGFLVAGMPTPAVYIDTLKLQEITASYTGISQGADQTFSNFTATVNFHSGDIALVVNNNMDSGISTFVDSYGTTYVTGEVGFTANGRLNPNGGPSFTLTNFSAGDGTVVGTGEGSIFGSNANYIGGTTDIVKTTDEYSARNVSTFSGLKK
jgi:hypothetical protein